MRMILKIIHLLVCYWILGESQCCDPAEIGQSYTLKFHDYVSGLWVVWYKDFREKIVLFNCSVETSTCSDTIDLTLNATMEVYVSNNKNVTKSFLIFKNVQPNLYNMDIGILVYPDKDYISCSPLEVFSRPSSTICNSQLDSTTNMSVIQSCLTSDIFPRGRMTVTVGNYTATSDCQKDTSAVKCVEYIPISYLTPGINVISSKIYPNVTNGVSYSATFNSPFVIELPVVKLSDCPSGKSVEDGYIKPGTSVSCLCILTSPGYPPGHAQWFSENTLFEDSINFANGSASITVYINGTDNSTDYICKGISAFTISSSTITGIAFPVNFAYPAQILSFQPKSYLNSSVIPEHTLVNFECRVNNNPPAKVTIHKQYGNIEVLNSTFYASCEDSGEYVCQASNSLYTNTVKRSVNLCVLCPLQLQSYQENNARFTAHLQTNFIITVDVCGCPAPALMTLTKHENGNTTHVFNSSSSTTGEKSKYKIGLSTNVLAFASVYTTIFNLTTSDLTNYTLSMDNGVGYELKYNFVVLEAEKDPTTNNISTAALGGTLATVVVIVFVVVVVVKRQRYLNLLQKPCRSNEMHKEDECYNRPTCDLEIPDSKGTDHVSSESTYNVEDPTTFDYGAEIYTEKNDYLEMSNLNVYDKCGQNVEVQGYEAVSVPQEQPYQNTQTQKDL